MINGTTNSLYPSKVDPWIFFQDITNDKTDSYNEFQSLTDSKKYSEAYNFAHNNDIDIYDAELLMCLQNRIKTLQTYIKNKQKISHHIFGAEPAGYKEVYSYDSNGNLTDITYSKIDQAASVPDKTVWVNGYTSGGPLLTQSYDTMVMNNENSALGYDEE